MKEYETCPYCGTHLAPGGRCDCLESRQARAKDLIAPLKVGEKVQLLEFLDILSLDTGKEAVA